jgi:hypothetical protein
VSDINVHWHILTGEYPPQPGGVSDYTRLVACGLGRAGDRVDVWAPHTVGRAVGPMIDVPIEHGVTVHRLPDCFGPRSRRLLARELDATHGAHRVLVQYVPHAFGWKAMNVPFCSWLRSRRHDSVWIMFHEVTLPLNRRQPLTHNALAVVTRGMAALACGAAERVFVAIPAWKPFVSGFLKAATPIEWLPVPSVIPVADDRGAAALRALYGGGHPLVGHFGTFGSLTRSLVIEALPLLAAQSDCRILLLGRGGESVAVEAVSRWPVLAGRLQATGVLPSNELSRHVSACDVMMQPYPDGVSSRRTSVMVALSHGRPVVTTIGPLTEPLWQTSSGVVLTPAGDGRALAAATAALAADTARARQMGAAGRALYDARFDERHTISALRAPSAASDALRAVS